MNKLEPFYGTIIMIVFLSCVYCAYWSGHAQGENELYAKIDLALTHDERGYFIVNGNYGNFLLPGNISRPEALKALLGEISPCLLYDYVCEKKLPWCDCGV